MEKHPECKSFFGFSTKFFFKDVNQLYFQLLSFSYIQNVYVKIYFAFLTEINLQYVSTYSTYKY